MDFTVKNLIEITGAKLLKGEVDNTLSFEISTDTRNINSTKIFLPLIGEKFDGHNFIENACNNGVIAYFTQKEIVNDNAKFVLLVDDTKIAYLKIANYYKNLINPKTIAITGSAGKTTTKEIAYHIFRQRFCTHKSELNHNNEIGLAQTLLSMPKDTQILIVEMGMRGLGEIELLSRFAEPDVAIISNIGSAHIGRLGSKENIAKAKFEITKYLKKDGILIAHKSEYLDKINDMKDRTIEFSLTSKDLKIEKETADYSEFIYKNNEYKINLSGKYNIQNALGVIEAALYCGMDEKLINQGLMEFVPIQNRWQVENINGVNIINDAYNANPDSMLATIQNFLSVYNGRKVLILGDMGELGENETIYHKEIGQKIKDYEFDLLVTIGRLAKHISDENSQKAVHFSNVKSSIEYLKNNLKPNDWVLLKASRSMELEKILTLLKEVEIQK